MFFRYKSKDVSLLLIMLMRNFAQKIILKHGTEKTKYLKYEKL